MSVVSVRNSSIVGYVHTRRTGLISRMRNAAGAFVDSNETVLIADLSTQEFGHAAAVAAGGVLTQPYAVNDRQDNTGI